MVELNKLTDPNFLVTNQEIEVTEESVAPTTYQAQSEQAPTQVAVVEQSSVTQVSSSYASSAVVLANGNTAGEQGAYAAARMAEMTGVPASTWEHIIARESNGQVNATNGSGASGLFQTMPGWGSTATVDDQIQAAYNAYSSQGMSAWGY
ncbi:Immunodominant antigen A [Streptococcus sp. DD10]|nr:Immunodominant antigen A [Streptococcus sp. DD10]